MADTPTSPGPRHPPDAAADAVSEARAGVPARAPQLTDSQINALAVDRLSLAFETSAKRWELIVYPSLFAFIILAAYGFYLVFSLAKDVHYLALSVDSNMRAISGNMQTISDSVVKMSADVRGMAGGVDSMARDAGTLGPMLSSIQAMDQTMQHMTMNLSTMRDDMSGLSRNLGRPMQFMNGFMPW